MKWNDLSIHQLLALYRGETHCVKFGNNYDKSRLIKYVKHDYKLEEAIKELKKRNLI